MSNPPNPPVPEPPDDSNTGPGPTPNGDAIPSAVSQAETIAHSSRIPELSQQNGLDAEPRTAPYLPPIPAVIPTVPGYEILGELGRGGMGVVYKARHLRLNRIVALKMVLSGGHARPEDLTRFLNEAQVVAGLRHSNIVQVYDCGHDHGQPYFSMEFVEGGSLGTRLSTEPLSPMVAARLVRTLARAVHHAHCNGIVHRDLKPSNVLLDRDGQPKLTDFGLAKRYEVGDGLTHSQCIMGTPEYMAPEQAGQAKKVGPAADVYALGAILYHALTGRPPFKAATPVDTVLQVLERDPAPPRLLNPAVPRELELICLKCLEKNPRHRYASAEELAEDLRRYLEGEPITARSYNVLSRVAKALQHSHHDVEFGSWGTMLLWFAVIIVFAECVGMTLLSWGGPPYPVAKIMTLRAVQIALMIGLFWSYRGHQLLPTTPAERQLWSLWLGFLIGTAVLVLAVRITRLDGHLIDNLVIYPPFCVLSGVAFFALGGSFFGRCYLLGVSFFVVATVIPLDLRLAPLATGLVWAFALVMVGLHLRRIDRESVEHKRDGVSRV